MIEILGFVPTDIKINAVEISRHLSPVEARQKFPQLNGFTVIQNGDVHRLDEFLGAIIFNIAEATISEISLALSESQGRSFTISE
jgi:hypothetical protein